MGSGPWVVLIILIGLGLLALRQLPALAQGGETPPGGSDSSVWLNLAIVLILVLVSSLFVLAETAMLTVRRTRIDQLVEEGNRSAQVVAYLLSEPTRMLATLQVGLTLVQLFSAGAAADSAVDPLARFLHRQLPESWLSLEGARSVAFLAVMLSVTLLSLVVGEITPKSIAIRNAERISLLASRPIRWLQVIAAPAVWLVNTLSRLLVRPFGGTVSFHSSAMSEEELKIMVEQSEEYGVIEAEEKEMIHSIFDFADTVVRKVMTPRPDIAAVEADASIDALIRKVTESGHSRLPVFEEGNLDNIVGLVHVKDVLRGLYSGTPPSGVRELMRPAYFIPENKRVDDLLQEFRRSKLQLAVVRDEYGTITGIVTIEDLVEEIVGDIQDEYDAEEAPLVTSIDERTSIVDARISLEDFNDRMGIELPVEESDTLAGFVFGLLGHQPEQGEGVSWDGLDFRVEQTDGRRIQMVRVTRSEALLRGDAAEGAGAEDAADQGTPGGLAG